MLIKHMLPNEISSHQGEGNKVDKTGMEQKRERKNAAQLQYTLWK